MHHKFLQVCSEIVLAIKIRSIVLASRILSPGCRRLVIRYLSQVAVRIRSLSTTFSPLLSPRRNYLLSLSILQRLNSPFNESTVSGVEYIDETSQVASIEEGILRCSGRDMDVSPE